MGADGTSANGDAAGCAVCGAAVPLQAPPLFYGGRSLRFCQMACRIAFKREPDRYAPVDLTRPSALVTPSRLPKTRGPSVFRVRGAPEPEGEATGTLAADGDAAEHAAEPEEPKA